MRRIVLVVAGTCASMGCMRPPMFGNVTFAEAWFARDGRTALTTGGLITQTHARVWDVATGRLLRTLAIPRAGGADARWLVASDLAFVVASDGGVWDLATGEERRRLWDAPGTRPLALSPDDAVVYALADSTLQAWRVDTGELLAAAVRPVTGEGTFFGPFALAPDGQHLVFLTGTRMGDDGALYVTTAPELRVRPLAYQPPHPGGGSGRGRGGAWTQGVVFSPDGRTLAISDGFEAVTLFDVPEQRVIGRLECTFQVHHRPAVPLAFSADGRRLVVHEAPEYPGLCIFDVPSGRLVARLDEPAGYDRRLMVTVGATTLVARRRGLGPFEVYDLGTGERLREFCPIPFGCSPAGGPQSRNVRLSPDDRFLLASDERYINGAWDVATGDRRYWLVDPAGPRPWEGLRGRLAVLLARL